MRVAGRGFGKSGGYRVITFFTGPAAPAFLITVYGKGFRDDLTDGERNDLHGLSAALVAQYMRRPAPRRRRTE